MGFKSSVIFALLLGHACVFGQSVEVKKTEKTFIIHEEKCQEGIYANFEEFKYNQPSIGEDFTFTHFKIEVYNAKKDKYKALKRDDYWGFCTDGEVYYNHAGDNYLLRAMGRYCYFDAVGIKIEGAPGGFAETIPRTHRFLISFKSGKVIYLNVDYMQRLLEKTDPYLLKRYNAEVDQKDKLLDYVERYNERYKGSLE